MMESQPLNASPARLICPLGMVSSKVTPATTINPPEHNVSAINISELNIISSPYVSEVP